MYDVLDRYITEFSKEGYSEDHWYDVAVVHAIQLIDDLNEEDWLLLMEHIDEKDLLWKKGWYIVWATITTRMSWM